MQAELLHARAIAHNETGKPKLALQDITRALQLDSRHNRAWYLLGKIILQQGDAAQALHVFERGLSANPNDKKCSGALAKLHSEMKRSSLALKLVQVKEYFNAKQHRQALSELTLGPLETDPNNFSLLWMRSLLNLAAGDLELAERDVRPCSRHLSFRSLHYELSQIVRAIKSNPDWPKVDFVRTGELSKSGGKNPLHRTRWFYLKSRYLFYYKTPDSPTAKGVVVLHESLPIEVHKDSFCSSLLSLNAPEPLTWPADMKTPKRLMMIVAKTAASCADWTRAIQSVIKQAIELPALESVPLVDPAPKEQIEKRASPWGPAWRRSRAAGLASAVRPRRSLKVAVTSTLHPLIPLYRPDLLSG